MTRCRKLLGFSLILLGAACSNSGPTAPSIHYLEGSALHAIDRNLDSVANIALDAALKEYQAIDDLSGQWRIRYLKAVIALNNEDYDEALTQADILEEIAGHLDSREVNYKTNLILGRSLGDQRYYRRALSAASSPLQQAVASAYLGQTATALEMLDRSTLDNPGDRAFVYYQYAKSVDSATYYRMSLEAYKLAEDSRGIADSLIGLATIESSHNRNSSAQDYGRRAMRVLKSAGDEERARFVETWLSTL